MSFGYRGVRDGGICKLLVDPIEKVWHDAKMEEYHSSFVETISKPIMELVIDFMHAGEGSIEGYQDKFLPERILS